MNKLKSVFWGFIISVIFLVGNSSANNFLTLPMCISPVKTNDFLDHAQYTTAQGTDFSMTIGTSIVASLGGTVSVYDNKLPNTGGTTGDYGNYIKINHGTINGHAWETRYAHLSTGTFTVKDGAAVSRGQILALSGNSGWSTGPHLHFEVRKDGIPVDPYSTADYLWTTNPPSHAYEISDYTPVKFSDSNTVYLYSNSQLWPIANETVYTLLGFRTTSCGTEADWSKIVELPASRRSEFTIRSEVIGVAGLPPNVKISYKLLPGTCSSGPVDSTKIYALTLKNGQTRFNRIANWDTYLNLGYDSLSTDIVWISYDLLLNFGEGDVINATNVSSWISGTSSFAGDYEELEFPSLEPVDSGACVNPVASFSISPLATAANEYVYFTNTSSDPGGKELTGLWDFGNGLGSRLNNVHITYKSVGNYQVSLQAENTCGGTDSEEETIKICDVNQNPYFIASKTEVQVGETVNFDNITEDYFGHIVSMSWTFGDGSSSTAISPSHIYSQAGTFEAKLRMENVCGRVSYDVKNITVRVPDPVASYDFVSSFLSRDMVRDANENFIKPYEPSVRTTVFFKDYDDRIYAGIKLSDISQQVIVAWDVFDANNNLIDAMNATIGSDEGLTAIDSNFDFHVFGNTTSYGQWRAEVKIDGVHQFTENFIFLEKLQAPFDLNLESVALNSIKFNWQAVPYADGYKIQRKMGDNWIDKGSVSSMSFQDNSLAPGTSYSYRVYSTNKGYVSAGYAEIIATTSTSAETLELPGAPTLRLE
jgi:hypothetical protein